VERKDEVRVFGGGEDVGVEGTRGT
jgi:hypothetical protein